MQKALSPDAENSPIASRKDSHLKLAFEAQSLSNDPRFYYEPFLSAHPQTSETWPVKLGHQTQKFPIWISSMTGGTTNTNEINRRLAHTARKFGLGMGLGSSRIALENPQEAKGFDLRPILGDEVPFYLNFGIAQIEQMLQKGDLYKMVRLKDSLAADGFIIHVNPLQEWLQPEGDRIEHPPLQTIQNFLNEIDTPLIIKEVGQGFGRESMKALLKLPVTAIEFAASGGTNFSKLELLRNESQAALLAPFVTVGHSAHEMVDFLNDSLTELGAKALCKTVIISGGIQNFLDGYYLMSKSKANALYGQASAFLKYALLSQEALDEFTRFQTEGLLMARSFLKIKNVT